MGVLILFLWLFVLPLAVGEIVAAGCGGRRRSLPLMWVGGQMILWAVFQLLCVPEILAGGKLYTDFSHPLERENPAASLATLYLGAAALLFAAGIGLLIRRLRGGKRKLLSVRDKAAGKWYRLLWAVFWALLLFQLAQSVIMTYADGDDAYYVAVSTIAAEGGGMYSKMPYTGGTTGLDIRHSLAPFPIWIAFLSKISGVRAVTVAHVAVELALIPMTYACFYLIGQKICRKKTEKLPLFLVFTEILVLFGDYSFYTVENFMIARTRQGKAVLGSIVIPAVFFLFLQIFERIQEDRKVEKIWWLLLLCSMFAACLCSTMGAMLLCMLTGVTGLCAAVCYRKWKLLIPMGVCCVPAVCYALLYLLADGLG